MTRTRSLLAAPAAAVLLLGIVGGTAFAQEDTGAGTQACTDATNAAIEATAAAESMNLQLGVSLEEIERLKLSANVELAEQKIAAINVALGAEADRAAACAPPQTPDPTPEPTPTPSSSPEPPADDVDPPYETCGEAIAAGAIMPAVLGVNDSYQADLDSDGDGVACEANEGTSGGTGSAGGDTGGSGSGDFSQLDDVPSLAAETGGGPA